jgi:hypothetical protein
MADTITVTEMTDQARAEMVYDLKTAREITADATGAVGPFDAVVAAVFSNIQLERRLASHNPARKVFNSDPS